VKVSTLFYAILHRPQAEGFYRPIELQRRKKYRHFDRSAAKEEMTFTIFTIFSQIKPCRSTVVPLGIGIRKEQNTIRLDIAQPRKQNDPTSMRTSIVALYYTQNG